VCEKQGHVGVCEESNLQNVKKREGGKFVLHLSGK
jgi:hypothetical protein